MGIKILSVESEKRVYFTHHGAEFRGGIDLNNRVADVIYCDKPTLEVQGGAYGIQGAYREIINESIREFLSDK